MFLRRKLLTLSLQKGYEADFEYEKEIEAKIFLNKLYMILKHENKCSNDLGTNLEVCYLKEGKKLLLHL